MLLVKSHVVKIAILIGISSTRYKDHIWQEIPVADEELSANQDPSCKACIHSWHY